MVGQCGDCNGMSLHEPPLPLRGNYNPDNYKLYFRDTGLLVASLDEEAQQDLRNNATSIPTRVPLENIVSQMLVQQGYPVSFTETANP